MSDPREPSISLTAGAASAAPDAGAAGASRAPRSPYDDPELYDLVFREFDMDLEFWRALARAARGPVLELGCGSGRLTLPMLEAGADVDGLDSSRPMLARLEEKARPRGFTPRLVLGDMRDFTMPRRYALIAITFNAFLHNLTSEAQLATLRCCREHLEPGGALVMHVSFFSARILVDSGTGPVLELETVHPVTGHTLRLYDSRTMDPVAQIQHSINEIHEVDAGGAVISVTRSESTVRWIYRPELELLLGLAGYTRWEILGDFNRRPMTSENDQMIVFAWKD